MQIVAKHIVRKDIRMTTATRLYGEEKESVRLAPKLTQTGKD